MNKAKLGSYAPTARREFIQAVTDRAHFFGLSERQIIPVEENGDLAIIGGRPFPRSVAAQRRTLEERVKREGFNQVMESVAYTWFNRFLALRYMELHGYLEHGFRVLSNSGCGTMPEILEHAAELDLPGIKKEKIVELKLNGSKDAELYRILLVAQCNALNVAMPFLFEKIEDETELLLPDNLLHSDSLIRKLVAEIEEEDWQEVEIIGWLYQYYIAEKKGQVIGKVVKSEDIPAATQLFTPNWIVKYMVQNSLGRQWVATYTDSPLKNKMEYYIEPEEQTEEVKKQLAAITPDSLDPEKLTLLDPAAGSGHILVEAYDIFKGIYLERGYSTRDFPRLILENNLFGLDIDDRAAQMAGFALLMKARKDDRRILRSDIPVKLNVMVIQESGSIEIDKTLWGEHTYKIRELADLFRQGKTFGSLIQIPKQLAANIPNIEEALKHAIDNGDLYEMQSAREILPFIKQAKILAKSYNFVVANPPYMGAKGMTSEFKSFANNTYIDSKSDSFSMFIERSQQLTCRNGYIGFVTPFVWMFLTSYASLRNKITNNSSITSLVQLEYNAFEPACVPVCTFTLLNSKLSELKGDFIKLSDFRGWQSQAPKTLEAIGDVKCSWRYRASSNDFQKIPGNPVAYWLSENIRNIFSQFAKIGSRAKKGLTTADNARFIRFWYEVSFNKTSMGNGEKYFPMTKGGAFRKWYGNNEYVVNWENDGEELKNFPGAAIRNESYYKKEGITWNDLTNSYFSARYVPSGFICNAVGPMIYGGDIELQICMLNSKVNSVIVGFLCPTMKFEVGSIALIPLVDNCDAKYKCIAKQAISLTRSDWDSYETSWDFQTVIHLVDSIKTPRISSSWQNWQYHSQEQFSQLKKLETENNRIFIEAYGLQEELTAEVREDQITLTRADRESDMKRLISYAIGCMMGRYSLDQSGLVYANSGNIGFDATKYQTFPADDDGIVPAMDMDWFPDDAASRLEEFLRVAWSPVTLEENLKFVADSLSPKNGETPRETIRRYVSTQFYKDHLQTYKKRPIYWLFSSGKQRAFECLVYLHRYNEATLSRMRNEYVTPLQGKFSAQVDYLANEVNAASSTAERNRLQKQLDVLRKKQIELASFDDLLRHYADQRISLDLDDGVKVNYGKFGSLLSDVKTITGGGE